MRLSATVLRAGKCITLSLSDGHFHQPSPHGISTTTPTSSLLSTRTLAPLHQGLNEYLGVERTKHTTKELSHRNSLFALKQRFFPSLVFYLFFGVGRSRRGTYIRLAIWVCLWLLSLGSRSYPETYRLHPQFCVNHPLSCIQWFFNIAFAFGYEKIKEVVSALGIRPDIHQAQSICLLILKNASTRLHRTKPYDQHISRSWSPSLCLRKRTPVKP